MAQSINPILNYHRDAYQVEREDLKGRHSAGEGFLTAFLAHSSAGDVFALCRDAEHFNHFAEQVRKSGHPLVPRHVRRTDVDLLRQQGILYLADPQLAREAANRTFLRDDHYAICGVTHTIASREAVAAIASMVHAPVMPWDAVICTSRAVHAALSAAIANGEEEARARLGASRFVRPLMPVIPLGIHGRRFRRSEDDRKRWRARLGIADDVIAILFFGRLSVHAKASPFPLAQAVELAARQQPNRLAMVWAGRFSHEMQRVAFMTTAKTMAPSVPFHHADGADPDISGVWSAADIFCSLADNLQESFGLAVVEAMAAELPVIASNWDGYRDTVEHGATGFLVDTALPGGTFGDFAYRYFSNVIDYDRFIGGLSQVCVVDVTQTAHWLALLADDAELRRRLGAAGRRAVETRFDWSAVLPRYQELWLEQAARLSQARADESFASSVTWRRFDPAVTFADYPSRQPSLATRITKGPQFDQWDRLIEMPGAILDRSLLLPPDASRSIRQAIAEDRVTSTADLLAALPPKLRSHALRHVYWLVKIGLLRFVAEDPSL